MDGGEEGSGLAWAASHPMMLYLVLNSKQVLVVCPAQGSASQVLRRPLSLTSQQRLMPQDRRQTVQGQLCPTGQATQPRPARLYPQVALLSPSPRFTAHTPRVAQPPASE